MIYSILPIKVNYNHYVLHNVLYAVIIKMFALSAEYGFHQYYDDMS